MGYEIEFVSQPHQAKKPNPDYLNQAQQQLVTEEVTELCLKGAMELKTTPMGGFFSTLFLVPKKDGSQRPVINLKNLNSFVDVPHFKMEGIQPSKVFCRKRTG